MCNNIITNNILILLRKDGLIKKYIWTWEKLNFDHSKSLQENVGYSHKTDIEESIALAKKSLLETIEKYTTRGDRILDVGCGTGLFIKELDAQKFVLLGVDINDYFIKKAKENVPEGIFYVGDFINTDISGKFKVIYSIEVIQYIERSKIKSFFRKIDMLLDKGGIVLIHYPHALSFTDVLYRNLAFIRYSPKFIEKFFKPKYEIITNEHSIDKRSVGLYDKKHYYFSGTKEKRKDTNLNTCIFIARKIND